MSLASFSHGKHKSYFVFATKNFSFIETVYTLNSFNYFIRQVLNIQSRDDLQYYFQGILLQNVAKVNHHTSYEI